MKNTFVKSKNYALLAGLLFAAAGLVTASAANSSLVTFSVDMSSNVLNGTFNPSTMTVDVEGTFNNWADLQLVEKGLGTPYVYTNSANDTLDTNGTTMQYIFLYYSNSVSFYENDGSVGNTNMTDNGIDNRCAFLPTNFGGSLVLTTPYFGDQGAPQVYNVTFNVDVDQQVALGNFPAPPYTAGVSPYVELRGGLNGWNKSGQSTLIMTNNPNIMITNAFGLVLSNIWVGTFPVTNSPNAAQEYKYVLQPGGIFESPSVINADVNENYNRYYAVYGQTLPLVNFSDQPYAPIWTATFSVDMTVVAITDTNYNPSLGPPYSPTLNGSWNSFANINMTNEPAPNTNIWVSSQVVSNGAGSTVQYQFRYEEASSGAIVYDHLNGANGGGGNRLMTQPNANTNVPPVSFNDASLDDYLLQPAAVYFSVNMKPNGVLATGTDGHQFNPATDNVYLNGTFVGWYPWSGGITPAPAPAGYQMIQSNSSAIYTNTIIIPAGQPFDFIYKYGMDYPPLQGGPFDDEAGFAVNHSAPIRTLGFAAYALPTDTFGYQYNEPFFSSSATGAAHLSVGAVSGGKVSVTWLGRPGAHLQTALNVTNGTAWQDLWNTDGTNWTSGFGSTNGFVSQTNYPVGGSKTYFRLIKPK